MAPQEHRPIADRDPPFMLAGLIVGIVVAVAGVAVHKRDEAARKAAALLEPAPVAITATSSTSVDAQVPMHAKRTSARPVMPTLPGAIIGTSNSNGPAGLSTRQCGRASVGHDAVLRLYQDAFGTCGRTVHAGAIDIVRCDGDDFYDEAVIVNAPGAVHVAATEMSFAPVTHAAPHPAGQRGLCGGATRFVALPPGAFDVGSGGGRSADEEDGACAFDLADTNEIAAAKLASAQVFTAGDRVWPVEVVGFGKTSRVLIAGVRDGVYWRILANDAGGDVAHVDIFRYNGGAAPELPIIVLDKDRVARLNACSNACVAPTLTSLPSFSQVERHIAWDQTYERCLYACEGEPAAPAHLAPFDAFVPNAAK